MNIERISFHKGTATTSFFINGGDCNLKRIEHGIFTFVDISLNKRSMLLNSTIEMGIIHSANSKLISITPSWYIIENGVLNIFHDEDSYNEYIENIN